MRCIFIILATVVSRPAVIRRIPPPGRPVIVGIAAICLSSSSPVPPVGLRIVIGVGLGAGTLPAALRHGITKVRLHRRPVPARFDIGPRVIIRGSTGRIGCDSRTLSVARRIILGLRNLDPVIIPVPRSPSVGRRIVGILDRVVDAVPAGGPAALDALDIVQREVADHHMLLVETALVELHVEGDGLDRAAVQRLRVNTDDAGRRHADGHLFAVGRTGRSGEGIDDVGRTVRGGRGLADRSLDIGRDAVLVDIGDRDRTFVDVHETAVIRRDGGEILQIDALYAVALEDILQGSHHQILRVGQTDRRRFLRHVGLRPGDDMVLDAELLVLGLHGSVR